MKYAWASITKSCTNYGNSLIEYNLIKLLKKYGFNKPNFVFDSLIKQDTDTIEKINKNEFVIIPGCTTLRIGHYPGLESILKKIDIPIYNIGATFFGKPMPDFLEYESYFEKPITVRDPQAKKYLDSKKIENLLIGCPTLFTGNAKKIKLNLSKNIIFIFGLYEIEKQIELYKILVKEGYKITVILQEENQNKFLNSLNTNIIKYTPENIIRELNKAHLVVTGRLHGALPALALGVPVFFLETFENNRFSLLDYLGIKKHQINDVNLNQKLIDYTAQKNYEIEYRIVYKKIEELRNKFENYLSFLYEKVVSERKVS